MSVRTDPGTHRRTVLLSDAVAAAQVLGAEVADLLVLAAASVLPAAEQQAAAAAVRWVAELPGPREDRQPQPQLPRAGSRRRTLVRCHL